MFEEEDVLGKAWQSLHALYKQPMANSALSMLLLGLLIYHRSLLTPEFLHLVSAVEDDEAHCIFVTVLWLVYRCFLEPDLQVTKATAAERYWQECVKAFVRCSLELLVIRRAAGPRAFGVRASGGKKKTSPRLSSFV